MAIIPNNSEGYVKASAYTFLKRKYTTVIIIAAFLFACLLCAVFIRIGSAGTDTPDDSALAVPDTGATSDSEAALNMAAQENADLARQVAELTNELEQKEREYNGTQLLEYAMQLGHNNILLNLDDITLKSNAAEYQLNDLLQESRMKGLGWECLKAEREYGVNAIALIILTALETEVIEQGSGVRYSIKDRIGDTDFLVFDSYEECIDYCARLFGEEYLNPNGRFFEGRSFVAVYTGLTGDSEGAENAASDAAERVDKLNTTRG